MNDFFQDFSHLHRIKSPQDAERALDSGLPGRVGVESLSADL